MEVTPLSYATVGCAAGFARSSTTLSYRARVTRTLPLIVAGRTYAGALASAEEMVRGDERAHGYSTELQRAAVPVLAAAAVLAHRHGLTHAGLRLRLLGGEGGLGPLTSADGDDEARAAGSELRRFLADSDPGTDAHRNLVLAEAAGMLQRETALRRQARS
jgi:hypothetical protein